MLIRSNKRDITDTRTVPDLYERLDSRTCRAYFQLKCVEMFKPHSFGQCHQFGIQGRFVFVVQFILKVICLTAQNS